MGKISVLDLSMAPCRVLPTFSRIITVMLASLPSVILSRWQKGFISRLATLSLQMVEFKGRCLPRYLSGLYDIDIGIFANGKSPSSV